MQTAAISGISKRNCRISLQIDSGRPQKAAERYALPQITILPLVSAEYVVQPRDECKQRGKTDKDKNIDKDAPFAFFRLPFAFGNGGHRFLERLGLLFAFFLGFQKAILTISVLAQRAGFLRNLILAFLCKRRPFKLARTQSRSREHRVQTASDVRFFWPQQQSHECSPASGT